MFTDLSGEGMRIKDVLVRDVETCSPDARVIDAARCMRDEDVGFLPVIDQGKLVGVITDRDLVVRAMADSLDVAATTVSDIMSIEVVCCFEDEEIEQAKVLMEEHGIRRLPVIDGEHGLIGVVGFPALHGGKVLRKKAVKVTFLKEKTDSYGRPHKVPLKTVYITGVQDKQSAEAAAVKAFEEESGTAWTNVASGLESQEEPGGGKR